MANDEAETRERQISEKGLTLSHLGIVEGVFCAVLGGHYGNWGCENAEEPGVPRANSSEQV